MMPFINPGKPSPFGHSSDMAGGGFAPQAPNWGGMMSMAGDALGGFAPGMGQPQAQPRAQPQAQPGMWQRPDWQGRMGGMGPARNPFGGLFGGQFGQFQRQQPMGFNQGGFGGGGYQADPFAFAPMQHNPAMNGFAR